MATPLKILKLAVGLALAVIFAFLSGSAAEILMISLFPAILAGRGPVIKVIVVVVSLPLFFYLVESYFIRKEKDK